MKVALLMSIYSPWARHVALQLCRSGLVVHVIHLVDTKTTLRNYIETRTDVHKTEIEILCREAEEVHFLELGSLTGLRRLMVPVALRRIMSSHKLDLLMTLYGGWFSFMCLLSQVRPYVVYVVGSDILRIGGLRRLISRWALESASLVLSNGIYLGKKAAELAPKARVMPCYIGIDTNRFKPAESERKRLRMICTRGFDDVYNNEFIVRSLAFLDTRGQDWEFTFTSMGRKLSEVVDLANDILDDEVRSRVTFLNGVMPEELVQRLQQSHIYVSMSLSDGTSVSLMEALSCGLFPVLSDIPPNREWIDDHAGNGILVRLEDPRELALALQTAMEAADMRRTAAATNRKLVCDRANLKRNTEVLVGELLKVLDKHRVSCFR